MPLSAIRPVAVAALLASVFFTSGTQAQSSAGVAQKTAPMMFFPITWSALAEPVYPVKGTDGFYHLSYEFKPSNNFEGAFVINSVDGHDVL